MGFITFLLTVIVVYLFIKQSGTAYRVTKLEGKLKDQQLTGKSNLETDNSKPSLLPQSESGVYVRGTHEQATASSPAADYPTRPEYKSGPTLEQKAWRWLSEDWLMKLGALLFLIGIAWFVTYAIAQGWIGETGRITLGLVIGVIFLATAWWRFKKSVSQGAVLSVIGLGTTIFTLSAARGLYDMFTPASALGLMFIVTAYVSFLSVVYRRQGLSVITVLVGFIAPLLVVSPAPDTTGLLIYLLLVTLGSIWIVYLTGWRSSILAALSGMLVYSTGLAASGQLEPNEVWFSLSVVFSLLFFAVALLGFIKRSKQPSSLDTEDKASSNFRADQYITVGTGIFTAIWLFTTVDQTLWSLVLVVWAILLAGVSYVVYDYTKQITPFVLYGGLGLVSLGIATALELQGPTLVIAFSLEVLALTAAAWLATRKPVITFYTSLLSVVPLCYGIYVLTSYASYTNVSAVSWSDYVITLLTLIALFTSLTILVWQISQLFVQDKEIFSTARTFAVLYLTVATAGLMRLVWVLLDRTFTETQTIVGSLLIYTVAGLALYVAGMQRSRKHFLTIYGAVLLGFVVLRLLAIDVWNLPIGGRVVTFMLIGILLIGTAFVGGKKEANNNKINHE